jgi:hypothetical protein
MVGIGHGKSDSRASIVDGSPTLLKIATTFSFGSGLKG